MNDGPTLTDAQAHQHAVSYLHTLQAQNWEGGLQGLETFYRMRGGATLEHHLWLYWQSVRLGQTLTATGVSDNHWGQVGGWAREPNHFVTGIFATSRSEADLLNAQRSGRAYAAEIGSFEGQLDLTFADDGAVMGQVSMANSNSVTRRLTLLANGVPANKKDAAQLELWQIPVDGVTDQSTGPATLFATTRAGSRTRTSLTCRRTGTTPTW